MREKESKLKVSSSVPDDNTNYINEQRMSEILYCLSDNTRKAIRMRVIITLLHSPMLTRKELADRLSISTVNLFQHVEKLKTVGLISLGENGKLIVNQPLLLSVSRFMSEMCEGLKGEVT